MQARQSTVAHDGAVGMDIGMAFNGWAPPALLGAYIYLKDRRVDAKHEAQDPRTEVCILACLYHWVETVLAVFNSI